MHKVQGVFDREKRKEREEERRTKHKTKEKKGKIGERVLGFGIFNPGEGQIKKLEQKNKKRKAKKGNREEKRRDPCPAIVHFRPCLDSRSVCICMCVSYTRV